MDKVEKLIRKLRDEYWYVRIAVAYVLSKISDQRAVEPLIKALRDKDSDVREAAAKALGKIGDPRAVEPLIEALKDEYWWVRKAAVEALGKIGDPRAVEPLIEALRDKDSDVCYTAAKALEKIEPEWYKTEVAKKQVPEFINALRHEYSGVRKAAAEALGKIGDQRAVKPLIEALRDKDSDVRKAAAKALGKIGDQRAVESLIQALRNNDPDVRKAAAKALGKIGDQRAVKPLIEALRDNDPDVCYTAAEALKKIFLFHKPFLDSYPYLFCKNCMLRAEKRKVWLELFKRYSYVVCRGCGAAEALEKGIKKVIGLIGGNVDDYSIEGDTAYVNLWFEKEKKARNADIDILVVAESEDMRDEHQYDRAIDAVYNVLVNDRTRPRDYVRKIPVLIEGNPPLSIRAKRVLENEFGGIRQ